MTVLLKIALLGMALTQTLSRSQVIQSPLFRIQVDGVAVDFYPPENDRAMPNCLAELQSQISDLVNKKRRALRLYGVHYMGVVLEFKNLAFVFGSASLGSRALGVALFPKNLYRNICRDGTLGKELEVQIDRAFENYDFEIRTAKWKSSIANRIPFEPAAKWLRRYWGIEEIYQREIGNLNGGVHGKN